MMTVKIMTRSHAPFADFAEASFESICLVQVCCSQSWFFSCNELALLV